MGTMMLPFAFPSVGTRIVLTAFLVLVLGIAPPAASATFRFYSNHADTSTTSTRRSQARVAAMIATAALSRVGRSSTAISWGKAGDRWRGGGTRGSFWELRRQEQPGGRLSLAGASGANPGNQRRRSLKGEARRHGGAASMRCVCTVPPAGVSPLVWDAGMGTVTVAASVVWVKLWTALARHGKIKPQVSRKVVHTTAAPLFMVLWPFFTGRPSARFFAAGVPLLQAARLTAAGLSGDKSNDDASTNELVKGISRSGKASETLGGPLKYALVLVALTATQWRASVIGVVAILQLAVGDGMADLIGRTYGRHKWRPDGEKSVEGTVAFAISSFLASMGMIAWFHRFAEMTASPAEAALRVAGISIACAAIELMPPEAVGDDNFSVPVTAMVVGRLLFGSAAGAT